MTTLAHKIELKPTPGQTRYFNQAYGVARYAYNWGLARWNNLYDQGEKVSWQRLEKELGKIKRAEFPWMLDVTKCAITGAMANLGVAYGNYFRDIKKKSTRKAGRPKFKKKGKSKDSFYIANDQFVIKEQKIRIPNLGWVKMSVPLRYEGKIMSATVSKKAGRHFVTITVDVGEDYKLEAAKSHSVGIDLGIKTAVALSTGKTFDAPKPLKKAQNQLAKAQRVLSRRVKGSSNRKKAAAKVARIHARIENVRKDWINKTTTAIARKYKNVFVEDLNVKGMLANHKLAKAISDVSFGEIVRQLEYKTQLRGGNAEKINRFFPSSKQCRKCGEKHESLILADRIFNCPKCGHSEDRDLHAARNIHTEGLRQKKQRKHTGGQPEINAHGQQTATTEPRKRFSRKSAGRSGNGSSEPNVKSKNLEDLGSL